MQSEEHRISPARDHSQITRSRNTSQGTVATGASDSHAPAQRLSGLGTGELCGGNLVPEEFVEGLRDLFRGACFDDAPVRQAVAQELAEAPGPRQADVVGQPKGLLLES